MENLNKFNLNFDKSWEYVQDDLDKTNLLSSEILGNVNFKNGRFFTLLPNNANLDEIHNFRSGWILPPNPIQEYLVNGSTAKFSVKKNILDDLIPLMLEIIISHPHLSYFIDKVTGTANKIYYETYAECNPLFFQTEVYFLLNKANSSLESIHKCLRASTSFWHSLCVGTTADLPNVSAISLEKMKEICLATELIMVGAYDGEGYIFWEKKPALGSEGFFAKLRFKDLSDI